MVAARLSGVVLGALSLLPVPDGVSRHLRGPRRYARAPAASRRGLLAGGPVRRRNDAPLDAHRLSGPLCCARSAGGNARLRARLLRMDLPVWHAAPLLWLASPVHAGTRCLPRRREQDAHLSAREILPALRLPRVGPIRERDRRSLRSHLHRRAVDRPRGDSRRQYVSHRRVRHRPGHSREERPLGGRSVRRTRSRKPSGSPSSFTFTRRGSSSFARRRPLRESLHSRGSGAACSARSARFSASSLVSPSSE